MVGSKEKKAGAGRRRGPGPNFLTFYPPEAGGGGGVRTGLEICVRGIY